jgi:superfamily II DNA or RNA helicase
MSPPVLPERGQIARVRQRTYLVEDVRKPRRAADSTWVRLVCVDDDNQGRELEVLWEKEIAPQVLTGERWEKVAAKGFDEARLFAAYFDTLKWNCVTSTDPKLLQAPFRAGIRLDAYQLEPLRKALRLPRVNLFIADDVGLGKTIEAGLIARELLLRRKVREIVVACPPSMLGQWRDELDARFGLAFETLDQDYMRRIRRERGFGVNPWETHSRFLVSHRLLIEESYASPLRDHLSTFRPGTLLILDEAHHAAPSSGSRYAIDSRITRAIRDLAPRFEHRLFLSATPHNGHSNSFSALLEILDPNRFMRGFPVDPARRDEVVVRRLKEDLREIQGGFPQRVVVQIPINGLPDDAPELQLSRWLDEYRGLRESRMTGESRRKQAASALLLIGLQQRLLSSIEAFARTLAVHRRTVRRQWDERTAPAETTTPLSLDLLAEPLSSDDDRAAFAEDQLSAEEEAQVEAASLATSVDPRDSAASALFDREQRLLDQMTAVAEDARYRPDARIRALLDWIRCHMCPRLGEDDAPWNETRLLIFTEYDDTRRYLKQQLEAAIAASHLAQVRIDVFHGPTSPERREEIKQAFNADPARFPMRILIATDAAREGLNLQARCHNLFHFDVPWNPARMEQRNGRIDRKLQPSPEVYCHYFVYEQRLEDRILRALVRKTDTIRRELGSLSQVIDARLAKSLSGGIRHADIVRLEQDLDSLEADAERRSVVERELEASRDRQQALREQVDRLRTQLEASRERIGLDEEHFRSAISCSLELLGAERLRPRGDGDTPSPRFEFPHLAERFGADSSWADTLDTLRGPRPRDKKLWDWRREAPIREVVFEDPGVVGDEAVHLHLEHRVVQRLLGRFVAQGFVHDDLSRACLAHTQDAIPRVVLLGRLCLYGPNAARLHEELVPVSARWIDPDNRKEPLVPYARAAESRALALLDDALVKARGGGPGEVVATRLRQSAARDIAELLPHLEARAAEHSETAINRLVERGRDEAAAMRQILEAQRRMLSEKLKSLEKESENQLRLDFGDNEDELEQVRADRAFWSLRIEQLKTEITSEPTRIEESYSVQARRIEPVGLVYLWPTTG